MPEVPVTNTSPNVQFIRTELSKLLPRYTVIRDVIKQLVPEKGTTYLPDPSGKPAGVRTPEEIQRYEDYRLRAIFYNFVGRTLTGFIGQIYSRDAEIKVPDTLNALVADATGDGLSLEQLSKDACAEVLSVGRYGLLTDYPSLDSPAKKAEIDSGEVRPTIIPYLGENIINWGHTSVKGKQLLDFVVLLEDYQASEDKFNPEFKNQWRVLDIDPDDGNYRMRVFRDADQWGDREVKPKANGKPLKELPFTPIGSINNDMNPDLPPMFDMAMINVGHYRNSADNEESIFFSGQPTFVVTGIKDKWFKEILGGVIRFGSRFGLALEKDSSAEVIQAQPNSVVREGMLDKQEQLASMGAEFLRAQNVAKTATEASIDDSARTSAIANAAKNVSLAFEFALKKAAMFQGANPDEIVFKLNSEFDLTRMSDGERAQMVKEYQEGLLSWTEVRNALHKAGIATEDNETVKKEIEDKEADAIAKASRELEEQTKLAAAAAGNAE